MKKALYVGLLTLTFMTLAPQEAYAKSHSNRTSRAGGSYAGRSCSRPHDEMTCMVCAVYFEASSQGLNGMIQVGKTIETRMASGGDFPRTACGVVYQAGQFSFRKNQRLPNNSLLRTAVAAAEKARASGPNGATHYLNPWATRHQNHGRLPQWAYHCPRVNVVGSGKNQHVFYRCPGIITNGEIAAARAKAQKHSASASLGEDQSTDVASDVSVPIPERNPLRERRAEKPQVEEAMAVYPEDLTYGADAAR